MLGTAGVERTPTYGHISVGWPAKIYIHQLCAETGCWLEDMPGVITYRDEWWEREKGIHVLTHTDDDYD